MNNLLDKFYNKNVNLCFHIISSIFIRANYIANKFLLVLAVRLNFITYFYIHFCLFFFLLTCIFLFIYLQNLLLKWQEKPSVLYWIFYSLHFYTILVHNYSFIIIRRKLVNNSILIPLHYNCSIFFNLNESQEFSISFWNSFNNYK